jgi:CBS domain containing-hemolysin-like protein
MAVVDGFGTTAGIVTIEDIVEEIIGEVLAETESPSIRWLDDDTVLVRGELNVHTANEALGTDLLESAGFESIAGLPMHEAGRIVGEGESVIHNGVTFVVETAEHNRIPEVRVELSDTGTSGGPPDGGRPDEGREEGSLMDGEPPDEG